MSRIEVDLGATPDLRVVGGSVRGALPYADEIVRRVREAAATAADADESDVESALASGYLAGVADALGTTFNELLVICRVSLRAERVSATEED